MKLIQKIGSKPESINSTKTKQWGLFECPVCKEHVEKPLSRGRTNKSCGKQECRKAIFTSNIEQSSYTGKPIKINGLQIASRNQLRYFNAFRAWYGRLPEDVINAKIDTLEKAANELYISYEIAKLEYPNQSLGVSLMDMSKPLDKENGFFTVESKATGLNITQSKLKQLNKESGLALSKINKLINTSKLDLINDYEIMLIEAIKLKYSHSKNTEYLYLIRAGEFTKIGVAENPENRLKEISVGCPFKPEIVAIEKFGKMCYLVERYLHIVHADKCTNGEWFKLTKEDIVNIVNTPNEELIKSAAIQLAENKSNYIETTRVYNDDKKLNKLRAEAEERYIKACENYEKQKVEARKTNEKPVIETVHEWDERFAHDRTNQIQATTTHGMSHTELYKAWQTVKKLYGVDDKWSKFEQFAEDIGEEFVNLEQLAENARELPRVYPINSAKPVSSNNCEIKRVKDHKVKSAVARKVGQYNTEGDKIAVYETCRAAAEKVGCQASKISAVCRGTRKTSGGYIWRYEE